MRLEAGAPRHSTTTRIFDLIRIILRVLTRATWMPLLMPLIPVAVVTLTLPQAWRRLTQKKASGILNSVPNAIEQEAPKARKVENATNPKDRFLGRSNI